MAKLEEHIFQILSLEFLVAIGNRIKYVPGHVSKLTRLRGLYLSSNILETIPDSLSLCSCLQECYLDNNMLQCIPDSMTTLPNLNILSLANNNLQTLPALPWLACTRIMIENNPHLNHLPYLVGCQQSILTYSSQASWAAMAGPTAQNILDGVWNMRMYGCAESRENIPDDKPENIKQFPTVRVLLDDGSTIDLKLPGRIERICPIPKLLELSSKIVYNCLSPKLKLNIKVTEDIQLFLPTLTCSIEKKTKGLDLLLPKNLVTLLNNTPVAFCNYPQCCNPIFRECHVVIVRTMVQRSWHGGGHLEMTSCLASRFYCGEACYQMYCKDERTSSWEKDIIEKKTVKVWR